jgi:uncharacterized YigZ family protein
MPLTISHAVHHELLVKKSRFIACAQPVAGRAQALSVVAALRAEHPGAAHVCWALLAGGDSAAVDDGEPGGTAGRPMLHVLRQQDLDGVLATVVRYFGGIKLGAGGLVRAYTDAIAQALLGATLIPLVPHERMRCAVPYALEGMVRREIAAVEGILVRVRHAELVHFDIDLAQPHATAFKTRVDNASQAARSGATDRNRKYLHAATKDSFGYASFAMKWRTARMRS